MMFFGVVGVHSICVTLLGLTFCALAMANPNSSREDIIIVPWLTIAAALFVAISEYCITSLYADLEMQLLTTNRLLDKATDGFCEVDYASGTIKKASPQMVSTFALTQLVGARLDEFVHADDADRVASLSTRRDDDSMMHTQILVTCS